MFLHFTPSAALHSLLDRWTFLMETSRYISITTPTRLLSVLVTWLNTCSATLLNVAQGGSLSFCKTAAPS